jgi:hypothetical protein
MRWLARLCALFLALWTGGCAIIEAEKDNRGGFLDQAADDVWMKADSKKMRALRAVTIEASLARIAMITPKSAPDRALLARRIGETTKRADFVRQCAFRQGPQPCFYFDSVMVDYENALFDLALVALPIDDARNLLTRVAGGVASVSVNPLELVQSLLDLGREAFRLGRVVGAIYRDTLELEVQVWLQSPAAQAAEPGPGVPPEYVITAEKVAPLAAAYFRGNDNIPVWRAAIADLRAQGLEPVPDGRFILQIYGILTYICGQIVTKEDPAYKECAQPDLTESLKIVTTAAGSFLSPVVLRSAGASVRDRGQEQVLRDELRREKRQREALQTELDKLRKAKQSGDGTSTRTPLTKAEEHCDAPIDDACSKLANYLYTVDGRINVASRNELDKLMQKQAIADEIDRIQPPQAGRRAGVVVVVTKRQFESARKLLLQEAIDQGVIKTQPSGSGTTISKAEDRCDKPIDDACSVLAKYLYTTDGRINVASRIELDKLMQKKEIADEIDRIQPPQAGRRAGAVVVVTKRQFEPARKLLLQEARREGLVH